MEILQALEGKLRACRAWEGIRLRFTGEKNLYVSVSPVAPYITVLPSFHRVEHILTECYEDTTLHGPTVRVILSDIFYSKKNSA